MSKYSLSLSQQASLDMAVRVLRAGFPDLSEAQLIELLAAQKMPLPSYSTLQNALVTNVSSVMVGASTLCYGINPDTNQNSIVLIQRAEIGADGQHQYGTLGGFINPGFPSKNEKGSFDACSGEQPKQGAIRENQEELLDDKGNPLLSLETKRLVIINDGIDESHLSEGRLATHYVVYAVQLTSDEMQKVVAHSNQMENDKNYNQAVRAQSHGEVTNVVVMELDRAAALKPEQFTHKHSLVDIQILRDLLNGADHACLFSQKTKVAASLLDKKTHLNLG